MEGRNSFKVSFLNPLIDNYQKVIVTLYMPIVGKDAAVLYMLLVEDKNSDMYGSKLERLCTLTSLDIDSLQKAFKELEQCSLVKTFISQNKDSYLFKVISPLTPVEFFKHELLSRRYLNAVGKTEYETSKYMYTANQADTEEYVDITAPLDLSVMKDWSEEDEKVYQKSSEVQPELPINFDYAEFLQSCTDLVFPYSLRTEENLYAIGQLATMFAVPAKEMRKLVGKNIKDYGKLDLADLKKRCINDKEIDYKEVEDPYTLSPVQFLYSKQMVPVAAADKKLLEYLQTELHMNGEMINILIEQCLENTNGRFNKNYVEKVATAWVRQGVDTPEKAKEAGSTITKKEARITKKDMEVEEVDIEELRKQMFGEK